MELSQRYPQLRLRQLPSGNISLKSSKRPRSRVKTTDVAQSLNQKWARETLGEWSREAPGEETQSKEGGN